MLYLSGALAGFAMYVRLQHSGFGVLEFWTVQAEAGGSNDFRDSSDAGCRVQPTFTKDYLECKTLRVYSKRACPTPASDGSFG